MPIAAHHKSKKTEESNMAEDTKTAKQPKKDGAKFVGIDIGTNFVVSAVEENEAKTKYSIIRSAFLQLERITRNIKVLKNLEHAYIDTGDKLFLVGDPAVDLANMFTEEVKRPMKKGVLAPSEKDAIEVMRLLIKEVLKDVAGPGSVVAYSSPADPVDGSFNTLYHRDLMQNILLKDVGVAKAIPMNEAHALSYAELSDDGYTGLCFSFGAGMVNAVLSYAGMDAVKFSISKGGDWIDQNAAMSRGTTASQMQVKKEEGVDILNPKTPDEQAIAIYYRALITEAVDSFNKMFKDAEKTIQVKKPIPVVIAGGTSLAGGFIDLFKQIVKEKGFPLPIKEIRPARDALRSVAEGLLIAAMESEE
jgi:hypothetical protein